MANFAQKDYQSLLVGKTGDVTTAGTTIGGLGDGEIGIFTTGGTKLTESAAATTDKFILAVGRGTGTDPLVSPVIDKTKVTAKGVKVTVADTQQLDYIGSNGTTGSIAVANNTVYRASINMIESPNTNHGGVYVKDLVYESDASATQAEIALGLANSGIGNFSREYDKPIRFRAISDHALDTNYTMDETVTVTNGSKKISIGTDYDYNTGTDLVVGDFVRIADTDATVATTDDVYRIEVITSTSDIELDRPYQGTTGTRTHGNNSTQAITVAQAAAANWGVSLTGLDLDFTVGKINDKIAKWALSLDSSSFTTTTLLNSAAAALGAGTYNQIAELEAFISGNNGDFFRKGEPNIFGYVKMTVAGVTYDLIDIEFETGRTDSLGYANTPKRVTLAVPNATPDWATSLGDDVTDVLEVLLYGAAGGELAI
jgi:hypothetical protein